MLIVDLPRALPRDMWTAVDWGSFGVMSQGPIEFASDPVVDDKGPTEFGGTAGLIQDASRRDELTVSEKRGLIVRGEAVMVEDVETGLLSVDESALAVDPVSGLVVDDDANQDGAVVRPVDAPPRTGNPDAATI